MLPGALLEFSPCLATLFIKGFIRPLHDMESIDATRAIRQLILDALVNPARTIAGNEVNPFALLGSQFVQELQRLRGDLWVESSKSAPTSAGTVPCYA